MTVREVAGYLNVNEKTVYRLAQRRALPGFKVAGAWRFQRADIEAWIEAQKKRETIDSSPTPRRPRRQSGGR
jgi:excisionase family DNA binding protein